MDHSRGLCPSSCGSTWWDCWCLGQVTLDTMELCCVTLTCVLLSGGHSLSQLLDRETNSQEVKPLKADWFQRKGTSQVPVSALLKTRLLLLGSCSSCTSTGSPGSALLRRKC